VPELPEVETIRRQLQPMLAGRTIVEAGSHPSAKFTPARSATDHTIISVDRRAKFLILGLRPSAELIVHLGMTGQLTVAGEPPDLDHPHLRAWWRLDDGSTMSFVDIRRFGRIRFTAPGDYVSIPTLAHAGPEPFDATLTDTEFWHRLGRSRRAIKTNLLSQRPVAGLGNIYADEALWQAGINPKVRRVGRKRAGRLLAAVRVVLAEGLANGGTTLSDYRDATGSEGRNQHRLNVYGRAGHQCRRCGATLVSAVIDARTTTWCPTCQRR
jgi:formamidopyrimidine-DNA glycosylase